MELTKEQIDFLNKYTIGTWKETNNGIDIIGNFDCSNNDLTSIIVKFNKITDDFYCHNNKLTSLEHAPLKVGGNFNCYNNKLTSLEHAPEIVSGNFHCHNNKLTSLEHAPLKVGGNFNCYNNKLTSLEHAPKNVARNFYINEFTIYDYNFPLSFIELLPNKLALSAINSDYFNKELLVNTSKTIMILKNVWNDSNFSEIRKDIVIPKEYIEELELLGDLSDIGF